MRATAGAFQPKARSWSGIMGFSSGFEARRIDRQQRLGQRRASASPSERVGAAGMGALYRFSGLAGVFAMFSITGASSVDDGGDRSCCTVVARSQHRVGDRRRRIGTGGVRVDRCRLGRSYRLRSALYRRPRNGG